MQVFLDTGSVVATIPEATTHAAGSALIAIKHASIEGLRTALQVRCLEKPTLVPGSVDL